MGVPIQGTGGIFLIFPTMVHTSVNPLKSEFLIYLHGGIYHIIHHGDYAIYTSMEVYEKYTPQGVNQECACSRDQVEVAQLHPRKVIRLATSSTQLQGEDAQKWLRFIVYNHPDTSGC